MEHFDLKNAARRASINSKQLRVLCQFMDLEYPNDSMLSELHVIRACHTVEDNPELLPKILDEAKVALASTGATSHRGAGKQAKAKPQVRLKPAQKNGGGLPPG